MHPDRVQTLGGVAFVAAGAVVTLGTISAEALYPGYSVADQTISALGAAAAPPAARTTFNAAMVVAGLLAVVGAAGLHAAYGRRSLTAVVAVTGVFGLVGVGLFPTQTGLPHFVAAMVAFAGIGVAALVAAATVRGPFRVVAAVLGLAELLALAAFLVVPESTPLGVGGLERWVAFLGVVWVVAFGGYLVPRDDSGAGDDPAQ